MDTTHITLEGRTIPLAIRRHRRARRISLRLSPARDGIVMTLPVRASLASGMQFFTSKAGWVLSNVETDIRVAFADGIVLPVLGQEYVIRRMDGRGVTGVMPAPGISSPLGGREDEGGGWQHAPSSPLATPHPDLPPQGGKGLREQGELRVHCKPEFTARRVRDFLKKHLRDACMERAGELAHRLGKTVREVKIRDTRSRWGSCSRAGSLTFHWQLVFAPPAILDYLIAHEVAHLKEMNHSERFWRIVAELCPDYISARRWLKREGHQLHRYGT